MIQYINLTQAEELTGLTRTQIKNLITKGLVLGSRISYKTYLVSKSSLIKYIESKTVNTQGVVPKLME